MAGHEILTSVGVTGSIVLAGPIASRACDDKLHNPRVVLAALLVTEDRIEEAVSALAEARRIRSRLSLREVRGIVGGRYAGTLRQIWEL